MNEIKIPAPASSNGHGPVGDVFPPLTDDWEQPSPLTGEALPVFPVRMLTPWVGEFVEAEATATQTPIDLPAMLALSVLATAAQKRMKVRVRAGWHEPLSIWTVTRLGSGERKSAGFADMTRPLVEYEREEAERLKPLIAQEGARLRIMEKEYAAAEQSAAREKDNNEHEGLVRDAIALKIRIDAMRLPRAPRTHADDVTPEKLAALLAEHGGAMAILSPEAEIFELMSGKYQGGAPNFNVFLKGHAGDDLRVDRVGRSPDYVREPALTLGLAVQPSVIEGLAERANFRNRGVLARNLFSLPVSMVGSRDVNAPPVPEEIRERYHRGIRAILAITPEEDDAGERQAYVIDLTAAAAASIAGFAAILEPSLAEYGQFGFMADWAGKLTGAVVRIAGLLHIADCVTDRTDPWDTPIEVETVERARTIGSYLLRHAMAAMQAMGEDEAIGNAKYVLGLIRRKDWATFTARDVQRAAQTRFRNADAVRPPLDCLADRGYIRQRLRLDAPKGRPPSPEYDVNPLLEGAH